MKTRQKNIRNLKEEQTRQIGNSQVAEQYVVLN